MRVLITYSKIAVIFCSIVCLQNCANEMAPTGGTRDTTPPTLIESLPKNEQARFKGNTIKLKFDELIVSPINMAEIFITPELKKQPSLDAIGKTVTIKFKDSLAENTTYTIHFGKAIKDVTEKNVFENLSYTFSTGDSIDQDKIIGRVVDAESLNGVENIVVGLWADSNFSTKPIYYTKTDKSGFWQLKHLKPGTYTVLAYDDKNGSKIYDFGDERVGFQSTKLATKDSLENIIALFFDNKKTGISSIELTDRKAIVAFNKSLQNIEISSLPKPIVEFAVLNENRDTVFYWFKVPSDSLTMTFKLNDTSIIKKIKVVESKDEFNLSSNTKSKISPKATLSITANNPIKKILAKKILIKEDSTKTIALSDANIVIKNNQAKLQFTKNETSRYWIDITDSAVIDIFGNHNKGWGFWIQTGKETDYGNLIVKKEDKEYFLILEVVDADRKVIERAFLSNTNPTHTFEQLTKGNYTILGVIDANKNGYWDGGDFSQKTQPDKKVILKENIEIKGGWDVEAEIKLNEIKNGDNTSNKRTKPDTRR